MNQPRLFFIYVVIIMLVGVCMCMSVWVLDMQQYIDILPYCDALGSDTVSIYIHLGRIDISNIVIYQCINIKTV